MSSQVKELWPKDVFDLEDSATQIVTLPELENEFIRHPVFVANNEIAFTESSKIVTFYSVRTKQKVLIELTGYIQHLLEVNSDILICRTEKRIFFIHTPSRKVVFEQKSFPVVRHDSTGPTVYPKVRFPPIEAPIIAVSRDGKGKTFALFLQRLVQIMEIDQEANGQWRTNLINTFQIKDENVEQFQKLLEFSPALECHVHENKIALTLYSNVIVFDHSTGDVLFKTSRKESFANIALNNKYFVCMFSKKIVVRDVNTMQIISQSHDIDKQAFQHIQKQKSTRFEFDSARFALGNSVLISHILYEKEGGFVAYNKRHAVILISSLQTNQLLFKYSYSCGRSIDGPTLLYPKIDPNGLLLWTKKCLCRLPLPQHVLDIATNNDSITTSPNGPLKSAYFSCFQPSGPTAKHVCLNIINYDLCKQSLEEFHFAHRILILAVQENHSIEPSPHFEQSSYKWHDTIYSAARELEITDDGDRKILKDILREATEFKVLESGSVILMGHDITSELREGQRAIFQLEREIIRRLLNLEDAHTNLQNAYLHYLKVQGMTQLVGIALNLIPFIGGSVVAATTAVEGFSLMDVAERGIETGMEVFTSSETFEKRVMKFAGEKLDPIELAQMENDPRRKLLACLDTCATTPEVLHSLIIAGLNSNYEIPKTEISGSTVVRNDEKAEEITSTTSVREKVFDRHKSEVEARLKEKDQLNEIQNNDKNMGLHMTAENSNDTQGQSSSGSPQSSARNMSSWAIQAVKTFSLEKDNVTELGSRDASVVLAAYLCRYDPEKTQKYEMLKRELLKCFNSHEIDGLVLSDRSLFSVSELSSEIILYFKENGCTELGNAKFLEKKIQAFLSIFRTEH